VPAILSSFGETAGTMLAGRTAGDQKEIDTALQRRKVQMLPRDRRRLKLALFFVGSGYGLFLYLLPLYVRALGGSAGAVGLVLALQAGLAAVATALVGIVADRVERRLVMRGASLIALPGVAFWILAPRWEWLIPGAILVGLSVAGFPAMVAYLSHADDDQVGLFGSVFAFYSLGTIVTPSLGGLIATQLHSIRPVFGLSFVLLAGSTVTLWQVTHQPRPPRVAGPRGLRALVTNRPFIVICSFHAVLLCAMTLPSNFLGPYLQDVDQTNDAAIGLLGSCVSLGEAMISLSLGRLSARVGRLGALVAAQVVLALSLILLLTLHFVPLLVVPFLLRGVIITASTLLFAVAGGTLPASDRGAGFGLMEASFQVGAMAGAAAGGLLYGSGPARPFQVSLVLLAVTVALSARIRRVVTGADPAVAASPIGSSDGSA
jgi:predicted MFS family arabinose efflux permease